MREKDLRDQLEFGLGAGVALVALADIFMTLLVPGPAANRLSVVIRLRQATLPLWRATAPRRGSGDPRPSNLYAPVTFLLSIVIWVLLLMLGFGMMIHGAGDLFDPRVGRFSDGLWIAGSSLLTLGVSEFDADGLGRWVILAAAGSGFAAMTTAITFIFQVQAGLDEREPAVLELASLIGSPPTGIGVLELHASAEGRKDLPRFLDEWRRWSAGTMHRHLAYPVLNYFRSLDAENDWLATLEAVLDTAALLTACADERTAWAATLLHRTGSRAATRLCEELRLEPEACRLEAGDVAEALERLGRAGYAVRMEGAGERFAAARDDYAPYIKALARFLGGNRAPVLPREPVNSD